MHRHASRTNLNFELFFASRLRPPIAKNSYLKLAMFVCYHDFQILIVAVVDIKAVSLTWPDSSLTVRVQSGHVRLKAAKSYY